MVSVEVVVAMEVRQAVEGVMVVVMGVVDVEIAVAGHAVKEAEAGLAAGVEAATATVAVVTLAVGAVEVVVTNEPNHRRRRGLAYSKVQCM